MKTIASADLTETDLPPPEPTWEEIRAFALTYDPSEGATPSRTCLIREIGGLPLPRMRATLHEFVRFVDRRVTDATYREGDGEGEGNLIRSAAEAVDAIRDEVRRLARIDRSQP
jgi:hypothetical protein